MQRYESWSSERATDIIRQHADRPGATLPILHGIQEEFGHVPEEAVPLIAEALNLSRAEVHGVVTFYHDFRRTPAGRHVLKLCRAEACQAMGATTSPRTRRAAARHRLRRDHAATAVTLEPVYCLGLCACSPSAMLDGEVIGRLDADALDALARRGAR